MVASGLCRVVTTACARRPASWVTFKSAVIVHHPLRHHLAHRIRIHPPHREFLRPTTASSAPQLAVTEQPDRLALEAPPCLPSQTPEDDKDIGQVLYPFDLLQLKKEKYRSKAEKWRLLQDATSKALEWLSDTNKTQQDTQEAVQVLGRTYDSIWAFYKDIKIQPTAYRAFAACLTAAVDIARSAVEAREALWEADVNLKEAQKELDLARAQGAGAQVVALKVEQVTNCNNVYRARVKEFREVHEAVLESSGILNTPSPWTRKPAEIKREDYEWMLRAMKEILKYRDGKFMEVKQRHDASIAADKLNHSCEPGTEAAAAPIEQSVNEQIEQPAEGEDEAEQDNDMESLRERPTPIEGYEDEAEQLNDMENVRERPAPIEEYEDEAEQLNDMENVEERPAPIEEYEDEAEQLNDMENVGERPAPIEEYEDEAEQLNDMENVGERPAPIEEYEDEPERVENLESSKLYQRPTIRLNGTTAKTKPIQLKNSLAAHYPPIAFPSKVTITILETLHKLLEEGCYHFALAHIPHHLAERNWDCPEAVELSTWHQTFSELLQINSHYVFAFDTGSIFEEAVPAGRRVTYVCNHLFTLKRVRNQAVHPRPLNPMALSIILRRAAELARLFRDRRLQQDIQQLFSEITRVLAALKIRWAKSLKAGRTHELYHQIVADKVALQRFRNRLANAQVSASQERWAACTRFEKDIESLLEALPVAIQADEEARLEAELPPLVEMTEKIAAQVEKRNAEMQLRLEAVRKSRSDMVLGEMQFVLDKHVHRMRNKRFPYFNPDPSGWKRELGGVGSPLPSAEQGGPQEKLEPHERQGHQEHPEPQEQQDEKTGLGPSCLNKTSHARRAMIRNAMARDLQREERECEREQANTDADAHADATSMPTEEERSRPGFVPSIPEEEMWNDEAADKSESGDMGPDGYHTTTSGFFEMLEKREKLPLEDFTKRAMKEMAAAAAKATKAEQEGEKEEQVEAGESRRTTITNDTTFMKFLNEYKAALSAEKFMKKALSRRAAGIANMKQRRALEREYVKQKRTLEKKMKMLDKEIFTIQKEMRLGKWRLKEERRRREKEKATKAQEKQGKKEEEDKNKNEVEPTAAVDNEVDNEAATTNDGIRRTLAKLAAKKKELLEKHESFGRRMGAMRNSFTEIMAKLKHEGKAFIKVDHTEKAVTDGPSSHLVAKEADFDSPVETGSEAARDGGDLPAVGSEVTDVNVDANIDIGTALTEAEAEGWRTSIEAAVDADVKRRASFKSPEDAALKAILAMQEVIEEAMPEVTPGPEASVEVIPAGEVAVEEVATPETAIAEPSDTETSSIAKSADTETVASRRLVWKRRPFHRHVSNDAMVQNAVLESTPVQDALTEEAPTQETPSDEETPPLFLPRPRPPPPWMGRRS